MPRQNALQRSIHRHHWEERADIILALAESFHPQDVHVAQRLADCGSQASFFLDPEEGHIVHSVARCKVRLCPWCTKQRTAQAVRRILSLTNKMTNPRTITLTLRSTAEPLPLQLSNLRKSFRRLRLYRGWKQRVKAGIYTFEITWNKHSHLWHPHVHMIVDGAYFPQRLLTNYWRQASKGSDITWIEAFRDHASAAMELASYIGKPPAIREMPPQAIREYSRATRGLRMIQTFGAIPSAALPDQDREPEPHVRQPYITATRINYLAEAGEPDAADLRQLISDRWPQFRQFFLPAVRDPPPPPRQALHADTCTLDARIFVAFTRLRQKEEDGDLARYDFYALDQRWLALQE